MPESSKDFLDGLNLCSGLALGHGGAFVLQTPYLLFYPDRDGDGVPDGDPEVFLSGFGMEDAHAVANSLTWGPDGWLYGVQGSTVTANIRGIEFQQGVWRYHPITKEFELFSEGGGNNFGFDFDAWGNAFAAGNEAEPICHHVQGGYSVKGSDTYGPLHNPYTYGYFPPTPHVGDLGDSLSDGMVFYLADRLPERFHGACIAPHTRHGAVRWATVANRSSTFQTHYGGDFLVSPDLGFRPVDMTVGPDGAVYVADWYDLNISHSDPRDRSKYYPPRVGDGRVWKVATIGAEQAPALSGKPLDQRSTDELVDLLTHENAWHRRQARVVLASRRDESARERLRTMALESPSQLTAVEALWAHYVTSGLDEEFAGKLLRSPHEYVRTWVVRLLGDKRHIPEALLPAVVELARKDPSMVVLSQLASTAKRLPEEQSLAVLAELVKRDEAMDDPHIPLLAWWAFENQAISGREQAVRLVTDPDVGQRPLVRSVVAPRLMRRFTAEGTEATLASSAALLDAATDQAGVDALLAAMGTELSASRQALSNSIPRSSWQAMMPTGFGSAASQAAICR